MLNHTANSLERPWVGVSGIPSERCTCLNIPLRPDCQGYNSRVIYSPSKIPGVGDTSHYFKHRGGDYLAS